VRSLTLGTGVSARLYIVGNKKVMQANDEEDPNSKCPLESAVRMCRNNTDTLRSCPQITTHI